MADPTAVRELQPDAGLAIGLIDPRTTTEQSADAQQHIEMITGNVLSKQTWRKVQEWLERYASAKAFDIILARPVAGSGTLPNEAEVYYFILNQMWRTLSPNEGRLLVEIITAQSSFKPLFQEWLKVVGQTAGITVRKGGASTTLGLMKSPQAPEDLPTIP